MDNVGQVQVCTLRHEISEFACDLCSSLLLALPFEPPNMSESWLLNECDTFCPLVCSLVVHKLEAFNFQLQIYKSAPLGSPYLISR